MKVLSDIDVSGKRVFLRADLDVPISKFQTPNSKLLTEAIRLTNLKPTVDYLLEHEANQIIIGGHIDRPKGLDLALSTKQLIGPLEKILERRIDFLSDFVILNPSTVTLNVSEESQDKLSEGSKKRDSSSSTQNDKQLILFENLRFWPGEEANDPKFVQKLASVADIYVNDAFAVCHRSHASMVALAQLLPHAAGLHLEKEVEVLSSLLKNPKRPFVAIVGGAKLETKVPVIENLAKVADFVLVGGKIAQEITTDNLQLTADRKSRSIVSGQLSNVTVATSAAGDKDIDQESIDQFKEVIATAKTVVWNGPMGVFEEGFDKGTITIAQAIIGSGAYSVVGGGETTEFLASKDLLSPPAGGFSFVSSGGGAMLEFLAGKTLPALVVLE